MTSGRNDDDRFAELMAAEFPDGLTPDAADPGFRVWTPPDEPDEDFVPPTPLPVRPWSGQGIAGTGLVLAGLVIVLVSAFGVRLPVWLSVTAGLAFFGGVALWLLRLSKQPPRDGDGAVV